MDNDKINRFNYTGMEKTEKALHTLRWAATDEGVELMYMVGIPGGGWMAPDSKDPRVTKSTAMRMIRRLKEIYAPDESWEDIENAPPRDGVDIR